MFDDAQNLALRVEYWRWPQSFARKIIRTVAGIDEDDVEKEANAIAKICNPEHENIVQILQHN